MTPTDSHTLRVLEWDALAALVSTFAATPWGKEALLELRPIAEPRTYALRLAEVEELSRLIEGGDTLPLRHIEKVEPHLAEAAVVGAHLDGLRLLQVADFFRLVEDLRRASGRLAASAPLLADRLLALTAAPKFREAVEKAFLPDGTMLDTASPRLRELRRQIQKLQGALLEKLQKRAASLGGDSVVTMREGRYVISVTEHDRTKVQGIVHDRSQSGTTYFMEPVALLELGNDLRAAQADERNEVLRILADLTAQLRGLVPSARASIDLIRDVDSAWGKARWAARFRAQRPQQTDDPVLALSAVRHPLLLDQYLKQEQDPAEMFRKVIPIDLSLSDAERAVIISGPNTGGKTVALKTAGLAVVMIQAGLPITADPGSTVGAFDAVFADIGDEQSLALSLSTFSAHLKQVGESCRRATARSLVLLDELGVGTDPEEGAALASAVILALAERGTKVLITTHYSTLKTLSERDGRIRNAAFLFDEKNLAPTYQLVLGRPGASYALEIARRLGFPEEIVSRAEAGVGKQAGELALLLSRLAEEELASRQAKIELDLQASRLAALVEYNRAEQEKWQRLERTALSEARLKAEVIVSEARRETEQLIARIRSGQAQSDDIKTAHETFARLLQRAGAAGDSAASPKAEPGQFSVGQRVHVSGLSQIAEVTQILQDGKRIQVQIGQVHYTVSREALAHADEATDPSRPASVTTSPGTALPEDGAFEVDLRGKAVDESILELEEIIDAADRHGYSRLRVIHGRGTGVLRRELSRWLKQHARVKSTRLGGRGEGGDGVTIVELSRP